MLSDGHVSLIAAVERFDYSRGNKFSTYASAVLIKNYIRSNVKENRRHQRYLTGQEDWLFEAAVDTRSDEKSRLASSRAGADLRQPVARVPRSSRTTDYSPPDRSG